MVHSPVFRKFANPLATIQNALAANRVPRGQPVKILGQAIDLISIEPPIDRGSANVNYVPFIEQKPEICVNLVSNL
jgi:hypothetical protein